MICIGLNVCASSKTRNVAELKAIAHNFFSNQKNIKQQKGTSFNDIEIVKEQESIVVAANQSGMVILSKNADFNPILGYTDRKTTIEEAPPAFHAWLNDINEYLKTQKVLPKNHPFKSGNLKDKVEPLLETQWSQETPYNDKCPLFTDGKTRCPTGCVPTAIAQIVNYHKYPSHGNGIVSYTHTFKSDPSQPVELSFDYGNTYFDWDNMLPTYKAESGYSEKQANAVSTLMYACGVMAKAEYNYYQTNSSGKSIISGLLRNLNYASASIISILDIASDSLWMDIIYSNLSRSLPVFYSYLLTAPNTGHAVVLDGYDSNGLFHVNFGWGGSADGYYKMFYMQPSDHSIYQKDGTIIYNIRPNKGNFNHKTVNIDVPGTLIDLLPESEWAEIDTLKIVGNINGDDLNTLRMMGGWINAGYGSRVTGQSLIHLDLTDSKIVEGGVSSSPYVSTKNDVITPYAFECCNGLMSVSLPSSAKEVGGYAFHDSGIQHLYIPKNIQKIGSWAFSIANLNKVFFEKGSGLKEIKESAFQGCAFETFELPSSVETIGSWGFAYCKNLRHIGFSVDSKLNYIGDNTFRMCALESLNVPSSLTWISNQSFYLCSRLSSVTFQENSQLEMISTGAFEETAINSIQFPLSVKTISTAAFRDCKNLRSVTFAEGSKLEGLDGFEYCTRLREVYLPDGLKTLYPRAFCGCKNLRTVTIPASIRSMPHDYPDHTTGAFGDCESLSAVYSLSENPITFDEEVFWNYSSVKKEYEFSNATLYVPYGTKSIYEQTASWNKFHNIVEFDPTSIHQPKVDVEQGDKWFSISGQQLLSKPDRKGLYINNGKKVIIK